MEEGRRNFITDTRNMILNIFFRVVCGNIFRFFFVKMIKIYNAYRYRVDLKSERERVF